MLRLSKQADYATLLMSRMAEQPARVRNVAELAALSHVSAPMVSKTLKQLARSGLLDSVRGAGGGYRLSRAAEEISVAAIIRAVEGPIAITECSDSAGHCSLHEHCRVRPHWQRINSTIRQSLEQLSLAELLQPAQLLQQHDAEGLISNAH